MRPCLGSASSGYTMAVPTTKYTDGSFPRRHDTMLRAYSLGRNWWAWRTDGGRISTWRCKTVTPSPQTNTAVTSVVTDAQHKIQTSHQGPGWHQCQSSQTTICLYNIVFVDLCLIKMTAAWTKRHLQMWYNTLLTPLLKYGFYLILQLC